ncbi:MAG: hypothetical protein Q8S44_01385 [Flavobacteriaceae bacterium]|nr:hypothetical protein [Flavobacteriaceae bacterium]
MKKLIFLMMVLGFLPLSNLFAQQGQTMNPEEMINMQMEKIKPALDLDNLESILVKNILIKYTKERMSLRNQNLEKEVMIEKNKEISIKQEEELSNILSEEQLEKYKKLQEEFRNRNANPSKRAGAGRM